MKIVGHRGARLEAPENTLAGIELALSAGVDGVEIDVRRTADDVLVVLHDATVDRTTDGTGRVDRMTHEELRELDAGDGERVPTLAEVVRLLDGRGALFVEIKDTSCAGSAAALLRTLRATDRALVKCFDHRALAAAQDAAPGVPTGCLMVARPVDPVSMVRAAGAQFLSISRAYVDEDLVRTCHAAGIAVFAWNCNDPDAVRRYAAMGIDWLGTDAPTTVVPAARAG